MNDDSRWQHSSQVHNGLQALTEFGMLGSRDWLILLFGMQLRRDRGPTLLAEAASGPCTRFEVTWEWAFSYAPHDGVHCSQLGGIGAGVVYVQVMLSSSIREDWGSSA